MAGTYDYSLIRAVPDPRRGEWVNIGVVVYLRDHLDVRVVENLSKLRVLAPGMDVGPITEIASTWNALVSGESSVESRQAVLSRLPLAHASPVGMFIADSRSYESSVLSILRDLVVPPPLPRVSEQATRLEVQLRSAFRTSKLLGYSASDIDRHLVVPNFPVDRSSGLFADFALRNGALRLTETIDFRVGEGRLRDNKRNLAALKAITLQRADSIFRKECIPSVVYAANEETLELVQPSLTLLAQYADRLYDANNAQDLADYMGMMHEASRAGQGANY